MVLRKREASREASSLQNSQLTTRIDHSKMLHHSHGRLNRREEHIPRPEGRAPVTHWRPGHFGNEIIDYDSNNGTEHRSDSHTFGDGTGSRHERPKYSSTRLDRQIDMQTAISELDKALKNAVQACTGFIRSFDEEISLIKPYADGRLQDAVWVKKHSYHEKSTRSGENDVSGESFRKVEKQLAMAYANVIAALSISRHNQPPRSGAENVGNDLRLCKKICESKDILNVFNDGSQHRSSFEHFLTEARIVEAIIQSTSYVPGGQDENVSENSHSDFFGNSE